VLKYWSIGRLRFPRNCTWRGEVRGAFSALFLSALRANGDSYDLGGDSGDEGGVHHCSRFGIVFANCAGEAVSHAEFIVQYRDLVGVSQPRDEAGVDFSFRCRNEPFQGCRFCQAVLRIAVNQSFSVTSRANEITMSLKTIDYHFTAAGMLLLSLSTYLAAQDATQSSQVLTPFGYRDSAHVHHVLAGYDLVAMPDGHIRMENATTGDYIDFPISPGARKPLPDNGWQTYAGWVNEGKTPVTSFTTTWTVPPAPSNDDGQTLFQFNSMMPVAGTSILQPVLQYGPSAAGGGSYWAVASWYVTGTDAFWSSLVEVAAGKSLTGVITLKSHTKSEYDYACEFKGIAGTKYTIKKISQLYWLTETLEVYNVDLCADYPNTAFSEMSKIAVKTGSKTPAVTWTITNDSTDCGVQTTIVTQGGKAGVVDIYF
jgi:hypothetical protein